MSFTFLFSHAFAPSTRASYSRGLSLFLTWSTLTKDELIELTSSTKSGNSRQIDELMSNYIHYLHIKHDGKNKHLATTAVYGVIGLVCPSLKGQLLHSAAALRGWNRMAVSEPRTPLVRFGVVAVVYLLFENGQLDAGVAILLAFGAFLRMSEVTTLKIGQIFKKTNEVAKGLHLKQTKTGADKYAPLPDEQIGEILMAWRRSRKRKGAGKESVVFLSTDNELRSSLSDALAALGVTERFTFHGLRHGAATTASADGKSVEEIMVLGRWAAHKSATHYINRAKALSLQQTVPAAVLKRGKKIYERGDLRTIFFKKLQEY